MMPIFFNLLVNSIFSLAAALLVVGFFLWIFKVEAGRWRLALLMLPFLKIVYDLAIGVPAQSVLFTGVDPFSLPPHSQLLTLGAGVSWLGVFLNGVFFVRAPGGTEIPASVGDYLLLWLQKRYGSEILFYSVALILGISLLLLAHRLFRVFYFGRKRREDRPAADLIRKEKLGWRSVDIYKSAGFSGTPFTGGIFEPYICFPVDAWEKLLPMEREAVIAHELGHVRYFDLVATVFIQILGDIFWFIPGYHWLSRKIDRLREIVADEWAVLSGADPALLASSLVKLKDAPEQKNKFLLHSAFFRERSLMKERVERLINGGEEQSGRLGWQLKWVRFVIVFLIASAVMRSTLGGNHSMTVRPAPPWLENLFK